VDVDQVFDFDLDPVKVQDQVKDQDQDQVQVHVHDRVLDLVPGCAPGTRCTGALQSTP
jgi:hypothetical protein